MSTFARTDKETHMDAAHASWRSKSMLVGELVAVCDALASNIFLEYRDIRGCSTPAAYRETREWLERYAQNAVADAVAKMNTK